MEPVLNLIFQILINIRENLQVSLGAQVFTLSLEQVQVVLQRLDLQRPGLRDGGGKALCGGAVGHVDAVHIFDQLHHLFRLHVLGEPAAKLGGEVELAVGKGAGAAEAAHGVAGLAVDAALNLSRHDGTLAGVDIRALLQHDDVQLRMPQLQLIAGKNARFAAADDGNICLGCHNEGSPSKN